MFYLITGGYIPREETIKRILIKIGLPLLSAIVVFFIVSSLMNSNFIGAIWAIAGWFIPIWIMDYLKRRSHLKLQAQARNMIAALAGLMGAGQTTTEAFNVCSVRLPQPLAGEIQNMLAKYKLNPTASYPKMCIDIGKKHNLKELVAVGNIIGSSEKVGGPKAAARGLKLLSKALRQRERLRIERQKVLMELVISGNVVIGVLLLMIFGLGIGMNHLFQNVGGLLVLGMCSLMTIGLLFLIRKVTSTSDID